MAEDDEPDAAESAGGHADRSDIDASRRQKAARDEEGRFRSRDQSGDDTKRGVEDRLYSKAFENLVNDPRDVVGLLAYSLYKQSIREEITKGRQADGASRNPPPTTVEVFRHSADRILQEFAASAIEEARPEFERSSLASQMTAVETNLRAHVDSRTSWGTAILTNIIGWAVTVVLAAVLLLAITTPSWYPRFIGLVAG